MNKPTLRQVNAIGLAFLLTPLATAQTQADEDVFELSPFTVNSAEDEGYRAQNTLSGTRLNSSLTDVGSSISVMTKDFLSDIGATDISDAFLYSTSTENEDEYASNDSEGISVSTTNSNRVRGIASSSYSRGFFDTNVRGDSYNTERFTLSYGPNAILYGVGSPAGIVDFSTKQASLNKKIGEVSFRFDTEHGNRQTIDYSLPIVENKFAVRIAAMNQDKKSWKQPDSDKEKRFFGTATFKPHETATIRYSFESMDNDRVKSRSNLPQQAIKTWMDNGKPLYDHINDQITYDNGSTWQDAPRLEGGEVDVDALYSLGIDYGAGDTRRVLMSGAIIPDSSAWDAIDDTDQRNLYQTMDSQGLRWYQTAHSTGTTTDDNLVPAIADESFLPYDYSIYGLASSAHFESTTHTLVWEQKLAENLYLELGYNKESWSRDAFDPIRGAGEVLYADVNYYMPVIAFPNAATGSIVDTDHTNGAPIVNDDDSIPLIPNPNAGRYYVEGKGIGYKQHFDFETFRGTLSYELDLTERNKWLGKHSVALLFQSDEKEERYMKTVHFNHEDSLLRGYSNGENDVQNRFYIDPPTVGTNGQTGSPYPTQFVTSDGFWRTYENANGSILGNVNRRELEGKMAVFQSRLLENRLITTVGFRKDTESVYQAFDDSSLGPQYEESYPEVPDEPSFPDESGSTTSLGAVYKANDWLKVFYNQSDSFLPQGQLHDYFNNPLPPADGEGKDIGIMLDLADGKLFARASWYEQTATGALELDWTYEIMKWRLVNGTEVAIERWASILPSRPEWAAERGLSVDDVFRPEINDNLRSIRDFKSEGIELELIAKPSKNLDLRLTFAKTESVNSRTLPNLQAYLEERLPIWEKYAELAKRPDLSSRVPDASDPSKDRSYGTTRGQLLANGNTIGNAIYVSDTGLTRVSFSQEEEGSASTRARKYRANFVANYNFRDGNMKGFGLGGGVRYRSKAAIGYEGKPNAFLEQLILDEPDLASKVDPLKLLSADITKPIYGDDQIDFDAWFKYQRKLNIRDNDVNWKIQVNVSNLFDNQDLVPLKALSNGAITKYAPRAPRTIALTNTFNF